MPKWLMYLVAHTANKKPICDEDMHWELSQIQTQLTKIWEATPETEDKLIYSFDQSTERKQKFKKSHSNPSYKSPLHSL